MIRSEAKFGTIEKEEVSLSEQNAGNEKLCSRTPEIQFSSATHQQSSRVQVIVTFLSILELMKMGYIHVQQDELFDDIQSMSHRIRKPGHI